MRYFESDLTNTNPERIGDGGVGCAKCGGAVNVRRVDALNHFGYRGRIFNGFSVNEHLGRRAWRKAGVDPPILARGVMLDIAALMGVDVLPPSYGIGEADLRGCLKHQGTELRSGDVVLIRTGRMRLWPDRTAYLPNPPGINREEFLAKAGARSN